MQVYIYFGMVWIKGTVFFMVLSGNYLSVGGTSALHVHDVQRSCSRCSGLIYSWILAALN
jgi:hypothetical protein